MTAAFHATPAPRRLARGLSRAAILALSAAGATAGVTTACAEDDAGDTNEPVSFADAYGISPMYPFDGGPEVRDAGDAGADSDAGADGDAADGDGG